MRCYNDFIGVLAQLGARNIRIVEATGSNPVYSTICVIGASLEEWDEYQGKQKIVRCIFDSLIIFFIYLRTKCWGHNSPNHK